MTWFVKDTTGSFDESKSFDLFLNGRFIATTISDRMAWRIADALDASMKGALPK